MNSTSNGDSIFGINVKIWLYVGFIDRKNFRSIVLISSVPFFILSLELLNVYHSWGSIFEGGLVLGLFMMTILLNSFLRIFVLVAKEAKFTEFMKSIDEWCLNAMVNNDHHALEILDQTMKRARFISTFGWTFGMLGCLMTIGFPLLSQERDFPHKVWLPAEWDVYSSPLYELMYTIQVIFVVPYIAVTYIPFTNVCAIWFIFGIGILQDLRFKLENLTRKNYPSEGELLVALKKCISYHEQIINYKNSLEDLISLISFFEFLLLSIMLCFLLFFILMADTLILQLTTVLYIFSIFYAVFLTYWHANEFSYESEMIADAAYNVEWISSSKELKKCIVILIARSQTALTIFAGGIYPMNLETCRALLNASYTFWTLLRSLSVK